MSKIILKVNKNEYSAWMKVNIFSTMNAISGIAELTAVNYYPGKPASWDFKLDDPCEIFIDDYKVISGYIDLIELYYVAKSQHIKIIVRDKTSDLNDCNWNESITEWKNQTVLNLCRNLCAPFSVQVRTDSEVSGDIGKTIETFKINEGEFIIDALMRFCNQFDLIPLSYGDGYLTLAKSTRTKKSYDAIDLQGNVIERKAIYSNMDRYSDYIVKGLGCGNDQKNNYADYIRPSGSVEDSVVQRYRPIVFFDDVVTDSGKCAERAKWIKQVRAGQSRGITYKIVRWTQTNGEPWRINRIVRVYDPLLNIDKDMLVASVNFIFDNSTAQHTEVTVVDKGTYTKVLSNIKTEFDA